MAFLGSWAKGLKVGSWLDKTDFASLHAGHGHVPREWKQPCIITVMASKRTKFSTRCILSQLLSSLSLHPEPDTSGTNIIALRVEASCE